MKEYFTILLETIRIEWRMLWARPTVPVAQTAHTNRYGERTHTTSRCAWN